MFNLKTEVKRIRLLKHGKIHGHPDKPKQHDKKVDHIDNELFEIKAEHEHKYMVRRFHNRSADFGRRLSKRKGQYHRPGGSRTESPRITYSIYQEI